MRGDRPRLVTTDQAADLVDRSPATIRDWVRQGHLEPIPGSRGRNGAGRTLWFYASEVSAVAGRLTAPAEKALNAAAWQACQEEKLDGATILTHTSS